MELGQLLVSATVAILLRLDRADLANDVWRPPAPIDYSAGHPEPHPPEWRWLLEASKAWLVAGFRRLANARERADDRDAANVAESLLQWRGRVQALWIKTGPTPFQNYDNFKFLDPLPSPRSGKQFSTIDD